MAELDGRRDAEVREPPEVFRRKQLRVFDSIPQPERRPLAAGLLEGVERFAVRQVADRVDGDRPAGGRRPAAGSPRAFRGS